MAGWLQYFRLKQGCMTPIIIIILFFCPQVAVPDGGKI